MENQINAVFITENLNLTDFENPIWRQAETVEITRYWSGETAPAERFAAARILWNETALFVRFDCPQGEPFVINETPNLEHEAAGLWDRDVCEIFVAPDRDEPRKYFEFEIAPNGEWIDLGIHQFPDNREVDWDYRSGMQSSTKIEANKITMSIKIEWKAFGKTPKLGDVWLGNLFRCVGIGATRGYLSWQPTKTPEPDFHVPQVFGKFEFVK
jgi:hypothetical protein